MVLVYEALNYECMRPYATLAATGAKGKIGSGAEIRVFPDQLLPQLRDSITPSQVRQGIERG